MYTESELKEKSFQDIKDIAETLGIEYTTKAKTIEVILSQQSNDTIPEIVIPEVKPEPKVEPKVEVSKPKGKQRYHIDAKVEPKVEVSKPKGKQRYRIDGTPINE